MKNKEIKKRLIDFISKKYPDIDNSQQRLNFLRMNDLSEEITRRINLDCSRLDFSYQLIAEIQKEGKDALIKFLETLKESDQIGDGKKELTQLCEIIVNLNFREWEQFKGSTPYTDKQVNEQESRQQKVLHTLGGKAKQWIEYLESSLKYKDNLPDFKLQLKEIPNAVKQKTSFDSIAYNPKQISSENITNEFKKIENGKSLLILGVPGSGKTTILLKLLKDLVDNFEKDDNEPVPVLFNLSSWTDSQENLENWLVNELNTRYENYSNSEIASQLIDKERLILLLDGLDEVKDKYRIDCLIKLNGFILKHGNTEIILCSRIQEYSNILGCNILAEDEANPCDNNLKLQLQKAFYIQPLESKQIHSYLGKFQKSTSSLSRLLSKSQGLRTPLVIFMIIQANLDINELSQIDSSRKIFDYLDYLSPKYVDYMLNRRDHSIQQTYPDLFNRKSKTKIWLNWLAMKMKLQETQTTKNLNQGTIFQIERMQPAWLDSKEDKFIYRITTGLSVGLILGLIAGFYFIYYMKLIEPRMDIVLSSALGLKFIMIGVLSGLISGFIAGLVSTSPNKLIRGSVPGIIFTLFFVLIFNLLEQFLFDVYLFPIFLAGLFGGSAFSLICPEIQPIETWQPQGKKILRYSFIFAGFGIAYVLIRLRLMPQVYEAKIYYALYEVIVFIIVGVVYGGFKINRDSDSTNLRDKPNQGIKRAARYTVIAFITFALSAILIASIIDSIIDPVLIFIGLTVGLLGALVANQGSGIVCIQHFILRFIFWRKGYIPWKYARFLDYASERVILRKSGGAYLFIHGKIMDYFAQMELNSDTVSRR
jgi:energy-coupling factor transporter ATP-binding protein EcfA2